MIVAVVGCLHGKLEFLYEELKVWETQNSQKVDFIICSGDFQVRKYQLLKSIELERCNWYGSNGVSAEVQGNWLVPKVLQAWNLSANSHDIRGRQSRSFKLPKGPLLWWMGCGKHLLSRIEWCHQCGQGCGEHQSWRDQWDREALWLS